MFPLQLPDPVSLIITLCLIAVPSCCVLRNRRRVHADVKAPVKQPAMHSASAAGTPPDTPPRPHATAAQRNQYVDRGGPVRRNPLGQPSWPVPAETDIRLKLDGTERAAFKELAVLAATGEAARYHRAMVCQFLGRPIS